MSCHIISTIIHVLALIVFFHEAVEGFQSINVRRRAGINIVALLKYFGGADQ